MHGRVYYLHELKYGFEEERFVVRVDCFPDALTDLEDPEFRIVIGGAVETTIVVALDRGRMKEFSVEQSRVCLLNPERVAVAEYQKILEVAVTRDILGFSWVKKIPLGVALWHGGLPIDVLPAEGYPGSAAGGREQCVAGSACGNQDVKMKRRATRSNTVLIAALLLIFVAASVFAFEYRCVSLLVSSMKNVDVPVPEGCSPSQTVPHDSTVRTS